MFPLRKQAASKLGIQWPAAQNAEGPERDLYDRKRLPPAQPAYPAKINAERKK